MICVIITQSIIRWLWDH